MTAKEFDGLLEDLGWSDGTAASVLGVRVQNVSRWRRGVKAVPERIGLALREHAAVTARLDETRDAPLG
jgi:hypothetical protein